MEKTQIILTVILLVVEIVAFAWLIIDIQKSKKKQDIILELERQILSMEESIISLEETIIQEIKELRKIGYKKLIVLCPIYSFTVSNFFVAGCEKFF